MKSYKTIAYFRAKASFDIDRTDVERLNLLIKEKSSIAQSKVADNSSIRVVKIKSANNVRVGTEP